MFYFYSLKPSDICLHSNQKSFNMTFIKKHDRIQFYLLRFHAAKPNFKNNRRENFNLNLFRFKYLHFTNSLGT